MSKLLIGALLLVMVSLVACFGEAATPEITETPEATSAPDPTSAPEQTSTPVPTATPRPTSTPTPTPTEETTGSESRVAPAGEVITPLSLGDPQVFLTGLSDIERACLLESFDLQGLFTVLQSPDLATARQMQDLNLCIRDGTMLQVFLGSFVGQTGALSPETSACLRTGFTGVDIRSMMMSEPTEEDQEMAMAGNTGAFLLAMSCLNDEEWTVAAINLGMTPLDRQSQECAMEALGGQPGMATALQSGEGIGFFAILRASLQCGVQMQGPVATVSTPATSGFGAITPLSINDPATLLSQLSPEEQTCISSRWNAEELNLIFTNPDFANPGEPEQILQCFSDDTVLRIFVTGTLALQQPLSAETSACIRGGMQGMDLRSMMASGIGGAEEPDPIEGMSVFFLTTSCLNETEWLAASGALQMDPGQRESMQCTVQAMGGPEEMAQALQSEDGTGIFGLMAAALQCGLQMELGPGG